MLVRLGQFTVRRRRSILIASVVLFALAGAIGGGVAEPPLVGRLRRPGGRVDPGRRGPRRGVPRRASPTSSCWSRPTAATSTPAAAAAAGQALTAELAAEPGVDAGQLLLDAWATSPPLRSNDGRQALVLARIARRRGRGRRPHRDPLPRLHPPDATSSTCRVGGQAEVFRQIGTHGRGGPGQGRGGGHPHHPAPAGRRLRQRRRRRRCPWASACCRSSAPSWCCGCIAELTTVSIFALNLTTAMGLGLAIDYSLFVVSRFREELRNGLEPADGRRPHGPHRRPHRRVQRGHGGRLAGRHARVPAGLPALVRLRRHRRGGPGRRRLGGRPARGCWPSSATASTSGRCSAASPKEVGEGFWHRLAMTVMRRPVVIGGSVVALLARPRPALPPRPARPARRPGPAHRRPAAARCRTRSAPTSRPTRPARSQVVAAGTGDPTGRHRRDRRLRRRPVPPRRAWPGSTPSPAPTSAAPQVAPPNAASARFAARRRHVVLGGPVGRAALGRGRGAGRTTSATSTPPFAGGGGGPVGRAGRLQGRPSSAGCRWPPASSPSSPSWCCS